MMSEIRYSIKKLSQVHRPKAYICCFNATTSSFDFSFIEFHLFIATFMSVHQPLKNQLMVSKIEFMLVGTRMIATIFATSLEPQAQARVYWV